MEPFGPFIVMGAAALWSYFRTKRMPTREEIVTPIAPSGPTQLVAPPAGQMARGRVAALYVFPIKGVEGTLQRQWLLSSTGLKYDREWVVMRADTNDTVTLDKFPQLKSVVASIDEATNALVVEPNPAAGSHPRATTATLRVPLAVDPTLPKREVSLFGITGTVQEQGAEAATFFTALCGRPVVLCRICELRQPAASPRHQGTSATPADRIAMHDYSTLHIVTDEAVAWLNGQLHDGTVCTTKQFRPNIVVSGVPFPQEDCWSEFTIGSVAMRGAKLSARCVIPTTADNAVRHRFYEPTATLRRLRSCFHAHQVAAGYPGRVKGFMFGIDVLHDPAAVGVTLQIGDEVVVTATKPPPIFDIPSDDFGAPAAAGGAEAGCCAND